MEQQHLIQELVEAQEEPIEEKKSPKRNSKR